MIVSVPFGHNPKATYNILKRYDFPTKNREQQTKQDMKKFLAKKY